MRIKGRRQSISEEKTKGEERSSQSKCIMSKENRQCSISTHAISVSIEQPCNGEEVTLFEDFTSNHNKTLISIDSFTQPPCFITIIIETRKGQRIVEEIRPLTLQFGVIAQRAFQVEDLKRVAIICDGQAGGVCRGNLFINKTFCICCRKEKHKGKFLNKIGSMFNVFKTKKAIASECFTELHEDLISFAQPCDGTRATYFEDYTDNHNKTLVEVSPGSAGCTITVYMATGSGEVIRRVVEFGTLGSFQVEDLKEVSIECTGNPGLGCTGLIIIRKTFCICCKGDECLG
ncbi:MAG: hypothetical protein ACOZCL_14980 [Bacillota bacterium]